MFDTYSELHLSQTSQMISDCQGRFETYSELHHSQTADPACSSAFLFETYSELHHSQTRHGGQADEVSLRPIQNYITLKRLSFYQRRRRV